MMTELRDHNPGVEVVGSCAVCAMPVRKEDDPTVIEMLDDGAAGIIHGAFDCMDDWRCDEVRNVTAGSGAWGTQHCQLPSNHVLVDGAVRECLWGEPG